MPQLAAAGAEADEPVFERRQLTVLFADLVESTRLMERVGSEIYAALLRSYHMACTDSVRARGGIVAQYQGDGLICFFGYPYAAEDDAARAVAAALDIVRQLEARQGGAELQTRIGIASGPSMVRTDGDHFGAGAIGSCINRAARLQDVAQPNTVLVCPATRRMVGDLFAFTDLGPQQLKGFTQPEPAFRARRRRSGVMTRFDALRSQRVTPLIGRDAELETLLGHVAETRIGGGRAVVIVGEAGLGKSRLVSALRHHERVRDCSVFVLQCSPEHGGVALHPVREYLEWVAGVAADDPAAARHAKLKRLFETVWQADAAQQAALLDLLSPLGAGIEQDHAISPQLRRRHGFVTLSEMIFRSAAGRGAMLLVVEDVHWIDPSTAEFLRFLMTRAREHPALVLLTTRPESPFADGGPGVSAVMPLERLSPAHSAALAGEVARGIGLPREVLDAVLAKAEGVPLFVEEYADMAAHAGGGGLDTTAVPLTLGGHVQSKLDRLDPLARRFAQAAAVIGRSFDPAVVGAVAELDAAEARQAVMALEQGRLVRRDHEASLVGGLIFSHALIRDAINAELSGEARRRLHGAVVDVCERLGGSSQMTDEVLAEHLSHAGRHADAAERFLHAAGGAVRAGAVAEALGHLEKALQGVGELPEGAARDRLELRVRAVQGPTQMVTGGPGNLNFGATQARAMTLLRRLDQRELLVPVLYNSALHAWARADLDAAQVMVAELDALESAHPGDRVYLAANTMRGLVAWHRGENLLARDSFTATLARYDVQDHRALYGEFLKDFGVFGLLYLSLSETVLGDLAGGARSAERAALLACEVRHPHAVGFGYLAGFVTAMLRGDVATAEQLGAAGRAFSETQGFPEFVALATFVQGWAADRRGDASTGLPAMEQGLAQWDATRFDTWQPLFAAFAASAHVRAGNLSRAGLLLSVYEAAIEASGENQARAPLRLARARLLLAEGDAARARAVAAEAHAAAVAQSARLWADAVAAAFPDAASG